jgi:hypothetical protein
MLDLPEQTHFINPERSEGSAVRRQMQIPRFARDDNSELGMTSLAK